MKLLSAILPLLGASTGFASIPPEAAPSDRPPVRVWMNNDGRFREGDYVRLQVDADANGFLLVLQYDPFGRIRVLFPLDPRDDNRVGAGRRYEIRDDAGRYAFRADGEGPGLIYSAISPEPWRFDEVVADGRWDYDRLAIDNRSEDPEPEITELVQRLAGPGGFDYDVQDYRVYGSSGSRTTVVYRDYGYDPYRFCDWYWGCPGLRFGISYGYDPYYYGYGYPYRSFYGYPYYFPRYPVVSVPRVPRAVVSGRPRNYTVTPVRPRAFGTGSIGRSAVPVGSRGIDWRSRDVRATGPARSASPGWTPPAARPARPPTERREFRPENRSPASSWNPPARSEPRSRPSADRGNSGGRRDGGNSGGQARGNPGGNGRSAPPAPARPRRP
jgi:hypothetical protein